MENIEEYIQEHVKLIKIDNKALNEASARASTFLVVQSVIASEMKLMKEALSQLETLKTTEFAIAVRSSDGKNITEKKQEAEAAKSYTDVRESFECLEANISYLKTHLEIFNNAHIQFRNLAKE